MGLLASIYIHGDFIQKVRAASSPSERLRALADYEKHMDEVENKMIATHQLMEEHHLGKSFD